MNTVSKTRHALLAAVAALALASLATGALAATTSAGASVDDLSDTQVRHDGGVVSVSVSGTGGASATGDLTHLHIVGADDVHYAVGAPNTAINSDFYFEVQGATGLVQLDFNFAVIGQYTRNEAESFTNGGDFSALLSSGAGPWPYKHGNFTVVQCVGCGGRLGGGAIGTLPDYLAPGSGGGSVGWEGENPGGFTLSSTFLGGAPLNGRLQLGLSGGGGNADWDFALNLLSITTHGPATGLSIYDAESGQRFAVTSASAAPEPASWALLIAGFGAAGVSIRRRRAARVG